MYSEKKQTAFNFKLNSSAVLTKRTFSDIQKQGLLGSHLETIIMFLTKNPEASVLEVGCGKGNALIELRKLFPRLKLYGLDQAALDPLPAEFKFIKLPIEEFESKQKFDLIFSVVTFSYVVHKKEALINIAKALKPKGIAFINLEPFYFGPYGREILGKSKIFNWENETLDSQVLIVRGGGSAKDFENLMQDFALRQVPEELLVDIYLPNDCDVNDPAKDQLHLIPIYCYEPIKKLIISEHKLNHSPLSTHTINRNIFPFLKDAHIAACPYFYSLKDEQPQIEWFLNPKNWVNVTKKNWRIKNPNDYKDELKVIFKHKYRAQFESKLQSFLAEIDESSYAPRFVQRQQPSIEYRSTIPRTGLICMIGIICMVYIISQKKVSPARGLITGLLVMLTTIYLSNKCLNNLSPKNRETKIHPGNLSILTQPKNSKAAVIETSSQPKNSQQVLSLET